MGGQSNLGVFLDKCYRIVGRQLCGLNDRGSVEKLDASVGQAISLHANCAVWTEPEKCFRPEKDFCFPFIRAEQRALRDFGKSTVDRRNRPAID